MNLFWPKPGGKKKEAVHTFKDGREKCNLLTKEGRDIYMARIREMVERQGHRCCLEGLVKDCPGGLNLADATFDHDEGRGMGGGHVDDRIWIVIKDKEDKIIGKKKINGAAHSWCNSLKGSVRRSRLLDMWEVP